MWLINTTTLALEEVVNHDAYRYAILSHTWDYEEVTFVDIADLVKAMTKRGFYKIERTCQLARDRGIHYAWIDTCCIDKSSSAELTEAINSMFRWYKDSAICFAYLSDLASGEREFDNRFSRCRWFARGWTLQELIAPKLILFYDQKWNFRGNNVSLRQKLSDITGIDPGVLEDSDTLYSIPIARRMCWAACRNTTRIEDLAYCLFGIFDVNLPLIYGEGQKAFIRLQEAIARDNNDLSLFAWSSRSSLGQSQRYRGIFAYDPSEFRNCGSLQRIPNLTAPGIEFAMTNRGVYITSRLNKGDNDYLLDLYCHDSNVRKREGTDGIFVLRLVRTAHGYVRHHSDRVVLVSPFQMESIEGEPVYIPKVLRFIESTTMERQLSRRFAFEVINTTRALCVTWKRPEHLWESHTQTFITNGDETFTGLLEIDIEENRQISQNYLGSSPRLNEGNGGDGSPSFTRHSSNYVAIFGFGASGRRDSDSAHKNSMKTLRPWAAIYKSNKMEDDDTTQILKYMSQEFSHGMPYVLNQIRALLLSQISSSKTLPATLTSSPSCAPNISPELNPISLVSSELSELSVDSIQGRSLRLSILVGTTEDEEDSIYKLTLKVEMAE